ncbi:hypothetical protein NXV81_22045 [Bacteroides ovatus]|nr:hypothetical protein [Bacteroides ovatus]
MVNSCRLPGNSEEEIAYHAAVVLDVNEEEVTLYDPATGEESTVPIPRITLLRHGMMQKRILRE